MTIKLDDGRQVQFETKEYSNFDHGYAATMHKSQGATAMRAHVLASKYMDRHAAYVSMSRQVEQVDMYYDKEQFRDFDDLSRVLSRDRRKDTTLDYLRRAEDQGQGDNWIKRMMGAAQKVREAVRAAAQPKAQRPAQTLKDRLDIDDKKTPEQRRAEVAAKQAARKLRDILDRHDDKRSTGFSL